MGNDKKETPQVEDAWTPRAARKWFWLGCGFELLLGLTGAGASWLLGRPLTRDLYWSWRGALWGLAAAIPLLALFAWTMRVDAPLLRPMRTFLERWALPLFKHWSLWQLAVISLAAGLGEEIMFRQSMQGGLSGPLGPLAALLTAGVVFGLCHYVNLTYAVMASLIGMYLGALWLVTGNLLAPVVTHAAYDFVALCYLMRMHQKQIQRFRIWRPSSL